MDRVLGGVFTRDPRPGVRPVPITGQVISVVLSFTAITVLSMFMSKTRDLIITRKLPLTGLHSAEVPRYQIVGTAALRCLASVIPFDAYLQ